MSGAPPDEGGGGRPAKLPAWSSSPPPPQQQPPPFLRVLPEAVCSHLLDFLRRLDVLSLLTVSKDVQQAVMQALQSWEIAADYWAAWCFLRRARNLQRFHFFDDCFSMGNAGGMIQAIGDGSVGAQLRSLILTNLKSTLIHQLLAHLKAGRLPFLTALGLADERRDGRHRPYDGLSEEDDAGLVNALEARGRLGLPPIARITGVARLPPDTLRRLWACCPPDRIQHLEARGAAQMAALGQHLLEHGNLAALRSLRIEGDDSGGGSAIRAGLASVWRALEQGHAPGIEDICMLQLRRYMGSIAPLGRLIGAGGLPKLAALGFVWSTTNDFRALIGGLRQAPNLRLRRLDLGWSGLGEGEIGCLAAAIESGGGIAHLEELFWACNLDRGAWVLEALVGGAPCARTLRRLQIAGPDVTSAQARAFLSALGDGRFPRLAVLEMEGWWVDDGIAHALSQALLRLVDRGTPSLLQKLKLDGGVEFSAEAVDALTPAFAGGGLPSLTHLTVDGLSEAPAASTFVQDWTALGPRIKLERLEFVGFDQPMLRRLVEAAADPAFCPSLRRMSGVTDKYTGAVFNERFIAALANRWRVRLGLPVDAASGGGGGGGV